MNLLLAATRLFFITMLSALLIACDTPGPGSNSGGIGFGEPDSNTPRDSGPLEGPESLCSIDLGNQNIIRVDINVTNEMLLPPASGTNNGLTLDVVRLTFNTSSNVSSDIDFREVPFDQQEEDGLRLICFDGVEGLFQPEVNIALKVTLPDGNVLYGPLRLTNGNSPLVVDVSTDFIVRRLFDDIVTSAQLNELIDCQNNEDPCPNQAREKAILLAGIAASADSFDIDIADDDGLVSARNKLLNHPTYTQVVDRALSQILRDPPSPLEEFDFATDINVLDGLFQSCVNSTYSAGYNTSFFRFGVGLINPGDNRHEVSISSAISDNVPANEISAIPIYPELARTVFPVNTVRSEAVTPNIPFVTEQLNFTNNVFTFQDNDFFHFFSTPDSSFVSEASDLTGATIDRFLSNQGSITLDRTVPAFIPSRISGDASSNRSNLGWSQDPVYSLLYSSNSILSSLNTQDVCEVSFGNDPTWLTTAYLGSGNIYEQDANDRFQRNDLLESYRYYSWEVHGLRTDEDFDVNDISGNQYGVISFGLQLESQNPFIAVTADIVEWTATRSQMQESEPTNDADNHYESRSLTRTSSTETVIPAPADPTDDNRPYDLVDDTNLSAFESAKVQGLIVLTAGSSNEAEGHSSSNGSYLSFVQDSNDKGRGIIVAMKHREEPPTFTSDGTTYELQGNTIEMSGEFNRVRNLSGSTLVIRNAPASANDRECTAEIFLNNQSYQFSFVDPSPTLDLETITSATSSFCQINNNSNGEIEIRFDALLNTGSQVTLKGFMSDEGNSTSPSSIPGNLMTLTWIEDDGLGLIFAQKDLSL